MTSDRDFKATGIILKYYDFAEVDKILHIFTKEYGLLQVIAKGIRSHNKKSTGNANLLSVNEFLIRKGKNLGLVLNYEIQKHFPLLMLDYDKLIFSLFLGELILILVSEADETEVIFEFFIDTLEKIEIAENPFSLCLWFQINLLRIIGYEQNFFSCDHCQQDIILPTIDNRKLGLSLNTGGVICNSCLANSRNYKLLNEKELKILQDISFLDSNELAENTYNLDDLKKLQEIFKEYLHILSEKKIKTLNILK